MTALRPTSIRQYCYRLRKYYTRTWHREWPESNEYLLELRAESIAAGRPLDKHVLELMRENHEFTPDPQP